jgi:MMPL family
VIRTVGATGGVITAAGLIFAASMFGLLFGSISMMVQTGFVLGTGLLLDTFLVRTVTVPAIATLVGRANWWPSKPGTRKSLRRSGPSRLARMRKALTPSIRRRVMTEPADDRAQAVPDELRTPDEVVSKSAIGIPREADREPTTGVPRETERQPVVLAIAPNARIGGWPGR